MAHDPDPVRLSRDDFDAAVCILGRAAVNDPMFAFFIPDTGDRGPAVINFMRATLTLGMDYGEVWTIGNPVAGVAWWMPPNSPSIEPKALDAAGFTPAGMAWRQEWFDRFVDFRSDISEKVDQLDVSPHLHLRWVGVDPDRQGKGFGRDLIRHTIGCAEDHHVDCTLFNFVPSNVGMYEHFGFQVITDTVLARSGLHLWTMSRTIRQ